MSAHPPAEPRLPDLALADMTPAQRAVHDAITSGPRGQVAGPLRVWLYSPEMAQKAQALGQYARYDSVLPNDMSELIILVTARYWSSGFEWAHHVPIALAAGLPRDVVDAIGMARRPVLPPRMRAAYDMAAELHRDRQVSDAVFDAAQEVLGTQGCVDLVAICGYYTLISMSINAFQVPDGPGPRLPDLEIPASDYFRH